MKISVILIAGSQAFTCGYGPCKLDEWINENWWASAVETFNSASDNWEQFADVVQSVLINVSSRADYVSKDGNEIF